MNAAWQAQEPSAKYLADAAVQTPPPLVRQFDLLATAPGGVARLRELILTLAVQGKLVPQDPSDEPASVLLQKIRAEKDRLIAAGEVKKEKTFAEICDEEKPFELPSAWEWVRLADVVRVLNGRAYAKQELLSAGTPVLRVGNLFTSSHWYYSDLVLEPAKYCLPGDLLYAWSASFGPFVWDGPKAIYHYHIWKLTPFDRSCFDARYWHTYLLEKTAEIKASGHGVSMVHMTKEKMEKIVAPLPPLAEQARIVTRVEELMRLCDALESQRRLETAQHAQLLNTLLGTLTDSTSPDELAANWQRVSDHFDLLLDRPEAVDALEQTILQLAVRGLLVPQDPNDEPASVLLEKIRKEKDRLIAAGEIKRDKLQPAITDDDQLFESPAGWCLARFGSIADIASDLVSPVTFGSAWQVAPDCIEKGTGRLLHKRTVAAAEITSPNHRFKPGQILYSKIRPSLSKAVVVDFDGLCSADMYPINSRLNAAFLHLYMLSKPFLNQVSVAENRVKMPKLNQESLTAFLVPIPPLAEQTRIVARVTQLRSLCADLRQRLSATQKTQSHLAEALVEI
ncbi:restriction endonuclease subunit S [Sphaerotilus mobilis]|uniref:Type I restriction enzyme S subunit n=1 Tax=Sphaerotilus mobilis TaxID=47994 RepID=A0A4Q7LHT7_9BURK|nr:restriction endonuclease subunit S [Sphaerotilus mobilis]RZS53297.1 type I restriction enzyme S subunit [Sphaerotilus mobilis]